MRPSRGLNAEKFLGEQEKIILQEIQTLNKKLILNANYSKPASSNFLQPYNHNH